MKHLLFAAVALAVAEAESSIDRFLSMTNLLVQALTILSISFSS